jgi:hypothetical protein
VDGSTSTLSNDDRALLTRLALGEASSDPQERAGVVATALNRVGQPGYADSVKGVVFQPKQFAATQNKKGGFYRYAADDYADARNIVDGLASGSIADPTGGATNFHAASMDPPPKWTKGKTAQQIGQTKFYGGAAQSDSGSDFLSQFEKPAGKGASEPDFLSQFEQPAKPTQPAQSEPALGSPNARVAGEFEELPQQKYNAPAMERPLNEVGPSSETLANMAGILGGPGAALGAAKVLKSLITKGIPSATKHLLIGSGYGLAGALASQAVGPEAGAKLMDFVNRVGSSMRETP